MENRQLLCDHCGAVLYGKVGTAYVAKDYISIKGKIAFEHYNKQTGRYDFVYITPPSGDELIFCVGDTKGGKDFSCFEDYAEHKIKTRMGDNPIPKPRFFGTDGEVKAIPEPLPEPLPEPMKRPVGRPRKESSLAPLERPANMPPFKLD